MIPLDGTDRQILLELQRDSKQTYAEIGEKVGLSAATVHARTKNLEKRGVISRYGAHVDARAVGLPVLAFVSVVVENGSSCSELGPLFEPFPEIEACHSVAGDVDLLLQVRTVTPEALENLLYRIKQVKGVARTRSSVVLSTRFEERPKVPPALD
jgi:Lrp/AsnC family transcriptional regulator, leucine-responsive regulatory protein